MKNKCLLFISLCLFSCSENENEEFSELNLIKREFYLEKHIESNSHIFSEYNENNELIKRTRIVEGPDGLSLPISMPFELIYNSNSQLIETDNETFEYDDLNRVKSRYDKRNSITEEVRYSNMKIEINSFNLRTFKLDSKNRVIEFSDNANPGFEYILKITYDNFDNIIKMVHERLNPDQWSSREVVEISYDQNPNPYSNSFKNWSNTAKLFHFERPTFKFSWWEVFAYFSNNNLKTYKLYSEQFNTESQSYDSDNPVLYENYSFQLTYNQNNLPTLIQIDSEFYRAVEPIFDTQFAKIDYY